MVGFGPDYACAHIIITASVNLLPIQADFVTDRDNHIAPTSSLQHSLAIHDGCHRLSRRASLSGLCRIVSDAHECVRTVQDFPLTTHHDVTARNNVVLQSDWTATIVAERTGR